MIFHPKINFKFWHVANFVLYNTMELLEVVQNERALQNKRYGTHKQVLMHFIARSLATMPEFVDRLAIALYLIRNYSVYRYSILEKRNRSICLLVFVKGVSPVKRVQNKEQKKAKCHTANARGKEYNFFGEIEFLLGDTGLVLEQPQGFSHHGSFLVVVEFVFEFVYRRPLVL